jgi:hypothetical protein
MRAIAGFVILLFYGLVLLAFAIAFDALMDALF